MFDRMKGGALDAGALFLAIMLGGMIVFWLSWFIAELIATIGAGICVGFVLSHLRGIIANLTQQNAALTAENVNLKQLMVDAQRQGVYARPVLGEDTTQSASASPGLLPKLLRRG